MIRDTCENRLVEVGSGATASGIFIAAMIGGQAVESSPKRVSHGV
jgi:hypothetical protein